MRRKEGNQVKGKIFLKIIFSIVLTNLLILALVASIIIYIVNLEVGEQSNKYVEHQIEANKYMLEQDFLSIEIAVQTMTAEVAESTDVERAKKDKAYHQELIDSFSPIIKKTGEQLGISRSIYLFYNIELFDDDVEVWYNDNADGKGFVKQPPLGREYFDNYYEWYNEPMDNGKSLWTFPYVSETGSLITSYLAPVKKDGEIIALVGMDLYLDDMKERISKIKLFDTGYTYLMDSNGNVITHPKVEWNEDNTPKNMLKLGDYQEVLAEMNSKDQGLIEYQRDDGEYVVAAFAHLDNGWILASSIPSREVKEILSDIVFLLIVIAIVSVILSVLIAFGMAKTISKPILSVVSATETIRDGDFTVNVQSKSNDETKLLADSLNSMARRISELIHEVKTVAIDMVDSASNLAAMSEETNATVDQVALTVEEISKGTQNTASEAEKGAQVAAAINEKFETLMDKSLSMQGNAEDAIMINQSGLEALGTLKEKSEITKVSNEKVADAVKSLEKRTNAITDIIGTISSIAAQTNLLALNASIEAARAGEAGKGFAVVADEIRKLAEDSGKATGEISTIVLSIQKESKDTVNVMSELNEITKEQNSAVEYVNDSFQKIFSSVEKITNEIEEVTRELKELDNSKNELVVVTGNISAVSEETAAATQEVNSSMDEQTKAVEEVAKNAEKLNALAVQLNEQINVFKVE